MLRATSVIRREPAGFVADLHAPVTAVLAHDERHLRRKLIRLTDGAAVLVDLKEPATLTAGDALVLDDGRLVAIVAAEEELCEVTARDPVHLTELAWHIGNRHLQAEISADHILIQRDHVIQAMLKGLGAEVREVEAAFHPVRGAYSGHGQHEHGRDNDQSHHHPASTGSEHPHEHP